MITMNFVPSMQEKKGLKIKFHVEVSFSRIAKVVILKLQGSLYQSRRAASQNSLLVKPVFCFFCGLFCGPEEMQRDCFAFGGVLQIKCCVRDPAHFSWLFPPRCLCPIHKLCTSALLYFLGCSRGCEFSWQLH